MTPEPVKKPRPQRVPSITIKKNTGCGKLYVTVGLEDGRPFEVFAVLGKAGGCSTCNTTALTRAVSQGIRHGVPVEEYIKLLIGSSCPSPTFDAGEPILSCVDAIGKVLREVNNEKPDKPNPHRPKDKRLPKTP